MTNFLFKPLVQKFSCPIGRRPLPLVWVRWFFCSDENQTNIARPVAELSVLNERPKSKRTRKKRMNFRRLPVSLETIHLGVRFSIGSKVNELSSILPTVIPEDVRFSIIGRFLWNQLNIAFQWTGWKKKFKCSWNHSRKKVGSWDPGSRSFFGPN